jgi:hypothetical protein
MKSPAAAGLSLSDRKIDRSGFPILNLGNYEVGMEMAHGCSGASRVAEADSHASALDFEFSYSPGYEVRNGKMVCKTQFLISLQMLFGVQDKEGQLRLFVGIAVSRNEPVAATPEGCLTMVSEILLAERALAVFKDLLQNLPVFFASRRLNIYRFIHTATGIFMPGSGL